MYRSIPAFFASLRLTVACLVMAIVLVFAGTLAQVDLGLWEAQEHYFQALMVFWRPEGWKFSIPVWPGGYLLGWILVFNLLAAHGKRFKFNRKKIGIFLTHAGVLMLLIGQFLTELFQVESFMRLEEGETKAYSESARQTELAVIDVTKNDHDVVVIPDTILAKRGEVRHQKLPFTIRIKEWYPNSTPRFIAPKELTFTSAAISAKPDEMNLPSTEIEVLGDDAVSGRWTVSTFLSNPQAAAWLRKWGRSEFGVDLTEELRKPVQFTHKGATYQVALRAKRYYKFLSEGTKPFNLTLLDFRHDLYEGTQMARNFSSLVRIRNPETGEDREALIQMNNPLRYGGEAYYQGSFDPDNDRTTILQVVRNPVWLSPYVACLVIATGLLLHFILHLVDFARRDRRARTKTPEASEGSTTAGSGARPKNRWLPYVLPGCAVLYVLLGLVPARQPKGFQVAEFGKLPILLNGRIQPLDSMARSALLRISGKSVVRTDDGNGGKMSPSEWLLEAMFRSATADKLKIFRLENMELRALFHALKGRFGFVSFDQIKPKLPEIAQQAEQIVAHKKEAHLRTGYERDVIHLHESLILYQRIKNTFQPEGAADFTLELKTFEESLGEGLAALRRMESGLDREDDRLKLLAESFRRYETLSKYAYGLVVPADDSEKTSSSWKNAGTVLLESIRSGKIPEVMKQFAAMSSAYHCGDITSFNAALSEYRHWLARRGFVAEVKKAAWEAYFNRVEFFYRSTLLYVAAMLLGCVFWINFSEPFRLAAVRILVLSFVVHTVGLIFRMVLEGRPPVTNLYSSAVFVGWGAALLGLILERIYRGGTGTVVAGLIGFVTLIIAHHLSLSSDTLQVLQAVLDTNIWLATHVVVVVSGYAAMFLAGVIAAIYIVRTLLARGLPGEATRALPRMVFGILCFATLFSFTGTVLGGIWADQSWGRFWGWDPKENGALMIVLWCAVILHARVGGLVKERGMMALAVFGNVITSFSWFGVNLLGVGLHNYGFMEGAFKWLFIFNFTQIFLLACFGILLWRCRVIGPAGQQTRTR